jgi:hypothetical protein
MPYEQTEEKNLYLPSNGCFIFLAGIIDERNICVTVQIDIDPNVVLDRHEYRVHFHGTAFDIVTVGEVSTSIVKTKDHRKNATKNHRETDHRAGEDQPVIDRHSSVKVLSAPSRETI